jgi:hypothetical protein
MNNYFHGWYFKMLFIQSWFENTNKKNNLPNQQVILSLNVKQTIKKQQNF